MEQLQKALEALLNLLKTEPDQVNEIKTLHAEIDALTQERDLTKKELADLKENGNPLANPKIKELLDEIIVLLGAATPPTDAEVADHQEAITETQSVNGPQGQANKTETGPEVGAESDGSGNE